MVIFHFLNSRQAILSISLDLLGTILLFSVAIDFYCVLTCGNGGTVLCYTCWCHSILVNEYEVVHYVFKVDRWAAPLTW